MIQKVMTQKAREIALKVFGDQFDQFGYPHMRKLDNIAAKMEDDGCAAFAYLQDVLVNSEMTENDLINEGISDPVAHAVEELKMTEDEYEDYLRRLVINPIIYNVILMDLYYESDLESYADKDLNAIINSIFAKRKYQHLLSIAEEQGVIADININTEIREIDQNDNDNNY